MIAVQPPPFVPLPEELPLPCASRPDLYFAPDRFESRTERAERTADARRLCAGCPAELRTACAAWARDHHEWGIWGGLTESQNGYDPHRAAAPSTTAVTAC
ncbi:WhiB family transcriptional regulator [Streptomyces sp. cg36]|uniref:WhiB family transcriptional regulator n=1 Tax=Streptomyces sp. cg36 TaxID=3238798 RepID=UPI0034E1CF6D